MSEMFESSILILFSNYTIWPDITLGSAVGVGGLCWHNFEHNK